MVEKLLIVEDDAEIASALSRGLSLHGYQTEAVARADLALDRLTTESFAGAIIDVMLGNDNGIDLVRDARAAGATLPILMLSALSDVDHRTSGLDAGADDYMVKPFSFDELVARLRVQERRALSRTPATLDTASKTLSSAAHSVALTDREYELLCHLLNHPGTPIARGALFDALWAIEGSASENVVDVYIGYLRRKLSEGNFGFEIRTVRNKGFCAEGTLPKLV